MEGAGAGEGREGREGEGEEGRAGWKSSRERVGEVWEGDGEALGANESEEGGRVALQRRCGDGS